MVLDFLRLNVNTMVNILTQYLQNYEMNNPQVKHLVHQQLN